MFSVDLSHARGFAPLSWLIMRAQKFPASHASIRAALPDLGGRALVFEATGSGVDFELGKKWDAHHVTVMRFQLLEEEDVIVAARAAFGWLLDEYLDGGYDFVGLWAFGLRIVAKRLGVPLSAANTPGRVFCSELVARWLDRFEGEMDEPGGWKPPDETAPADLAIRLDASPYFLRVVG